MRKIDTDALGRVAPALGVGNPATATESVDFDDQVLQQVLDVGPLTRRAGVPNEGMGLIRMVQTFAGAGSATTFQGLFAGAGATDGWPSADILSGKLDLWLVGASCIRTAGGPNTLTESTLGFLFPSGIEMPRIDNGTGTQSNTMMLARWTEVIAGTGIYVPGPVEQPFVKIGLRVPRNWENPPTNALQWFATADGAMQASVNVLVAFLRAGLGQDAF